MIGQQVAGRFKPSRHLTPLAFLLLMGGLARMASAIQVSPTYQVFEVNPGGKVQGEMVLTNTEPKDFILTPSVKDWFVLRANEKISAKSWLKIPTETFVLKAGETRKFSFTLEAPKKAQGELVGMISFSSKPEEGASVTMQISLAQYLAIKGTQKYGHDVSALAVRVTTNTEISVMMLNTGNVHLRPKGWVYVMDKDNQTVMNVELEHGKPAFPGAPRAYSGIVKNFILPEGHYKARIVFEDMDRNYQYPEEIKKFEVTKEGKVAAD